MNREAVVTVPRWLLEALLNDMANLHYCNVCLGNSPEWGGHDKNPPCIGTARQTAREALARRGGAVRTLTPTAWVPVVVIRPSGKPCICYHPWSTDEGCDCALPGDESTSRSGDSEASS